MGPLKGRHADMAHSNKKLTNVMCMQVLTPTQAGTFMVQAFPWAPDMLALAVAEEANALPVKQIFDEVLRSPPTELPGLGL